MRSLYQVVKRSGRVQVPAAMTTLILFFYELGILLAMLGKSKDKKVKKKLPHILQLLKNERAKSKSTSSGFVSIHSSRHSLQKGSGWTISFRGTDARADSN